jgi:hypothetical protein
MQQRGADMGKRVGDAWERARDDQRERGSVRDGGEEQRGGRKRGRGESKRRRREGEVLTGAMVARAGKAGRGGGGNGKRREGAEGAGWGGMGTRTSKRRGRWKKGKQRAKEKVARDGRGKKIIIRISGSGTKRF